MEVVTSDGRKLTGILSGVTPEEFVITVQEKIKPEGKKRPELHDRDITLRYDEVKSTKYLIEFK